jgi:hypothetical protein
MVEVAWSLDRIKSGEIGRARVPEPDPGTASAGRTGTRLHAILQLLASAIVLLIIAGVLAWYQIARRELDSAAILETDHR